MGAQLSGSANVGPRLPRAENWKDVVVLGLAEQEPENPTGHAGFCCGIMPVCGCNQRPIRHRQWDEGIRLQPDGAPGEVGIHHVLLHRESGR